MVETRSRARARRQEEERINTKEYNVSGKINNYNINVSLEIKKDKKKEITNKKQLTNNDEKNQDIVGNDTEEVNNIFNYDDFQPFIVNQYKKIELKYHSICNIM